MPLVLEIVAGPKLMTIPVSYIDIGHFRCRLLTQKNFFQVVDMP